MGHGDLFIPPVLPRQSGWGQGQSPLQARHQATGPAQLWESSGVSEEFGLGRNPDTQWGHSRAYCTHIPSRMLLGQSCLENRITLALGTGPRLRIASKTLRPRT